MPIRALLKNNVRTLRAQRNFSQERLALLIGVSRQTIMSIEHGDTHPSVLLALKIARAFRVPIAEVFKIEEVDSFLPRRRGG